MNHLVKIFDGLKILGHDADFDVYLCPYTLLLLVNCPVEWQEFFFWISVICLF